MIQALPDLPVRRALLEEVEGRVPRVIRDHAAIRDSGGCPVRRDRLG